MTTGPHIDWSRLRHGELIVLNCGMRGSGYTLFKKAKAAGYNGAARTFYDRLAAGIRDFSELSRPVNPEIARKAKLAAATRKKDPEFQAALAAVAARRGPR